MDIDMNTESDSINIPLTELNSVLVCYICNGYYRDAHTIPECFHTCKF